MKFHDLLQQQRALLFDGSIGTLLQARGLKPGACPEEMNLTHPEVLSDIHHEYVAASSKVIGTNTFGANRMKLASYGLQSEVARIVGQGVSVARKAASGRSLVALSLGPTGTFLEPVGPLSFIEALDIFREPVRAAKKAGADLVIVETMSDVLEVRAAAAAVREIGLPLVITMTFAEDGRTVLGTSPEVAAAVGCALGAVMIGANCSLGPRELLPIAESLVLESRVPVLVQANAGLPRLEGDETIFPVGPEEFAEEASLFLKAGVRALGGCCGTTPDHIRALRQTIARTRPAKVAHREGTVLASRSTTIRCGTGFPMRVIGERINPTGKKKLSAELAEGKTGRLREEAIGQAAAGAELLDVNVGVPGMEEVKELPRAVRLVQNIVPCPLVLDSGDPEALKAAIAIAPGKPLLNSVNGKKESIEKVLPLALEYGAAVLVLPIDKSGVPSSADARLAAIKRILKAAESFGMVREDIVVDCLTLAVGADPEQPEQILQALRRVKEELGLTTVLGVSNISYGLPARPVMNAAFLAMAAAAGLDLAIVNPYDDHLMGSLSSANALLGRDKGAKKYLDRFSGENKGGAGGADVSIPKIGDRIRDAVILGDDSQITALVNEALKEGLKPQKISDRFLIPALEDVGDRFGKKTFFLPQVIGAAETAKVAFEELKKHIPESDTLKGDSVLIATVEGDIHDIGKNIVTTLLENHGYRVIDMGTNVTVDAILAMTEKEKPRAIGLSALMTTTLPAMESTIARIREKGLDTPIVVGGAVVTEEYARNIGADGYGSDALDGVKVFKKLLKKK